MPGNFLVGKRLNKGQSSCPFTETEDSNNDEDFSDPGGKDLDTFPFSFQPAALILPQTGP